MAIKTVTTPKDRAKMASDENIQPKPLIRPCSR
jgi:hypothetical protein